MLRALALLLGLLTALPAHAASFTASDSPICAMRLDGPIELGDAEAFDAAQRSILPPQMSEGSTDRRMCLSSPGGSLAEAVKIARLVHKHGIGTVLEDGAQCLSACTAVFMMGTRSGAEAGGTDRRMHINARLGFHRPSLALPEGDYSNEAVIKAFNLALDATAEFVEMANTVPTYSLRPMIDADLIREMFAHEGEDFFYLDRVDHAGRWGIPVFGYGDPLLIGKEEAFNACNNLGQWPAGLVTKTPFTVSNGVEQVKVTSRSSDGAVFSVPFGGYTTDGIHACTIGFQTKGKALSLTACGHNDFNGIAVNGDDCQETRRAPARSLAVFPADARLADLPRLARQIESRAKTQLGSPKPVRQSENGFRKACSYARGTKVSVINVNNFVNVRANIGFDQPVVGEARKGARLVIASGKRHAFGDRAVQTLCRQTCVALGESGPRPHILRQLNQCFEDNGLWFQVRGSGLRGYVSGKFLRLD